MLLRLLLIVSLLANGFAAASQPHALALHGPATAPSTAVEHLHPAADGPRVGQNHPHAAGELACHQPEAPADNCSTEEECAAVCATGSGIAGPVADSRAEAPAAPSVAAIRALPSPSLLPLLRPPIRAA